MCTSIASRRVIKPSELSIRTLDNLPTLHVQIHPHEGKYPKHPMFVRCFHRKQKGEKKQSQMDIQDCEIRREGA